MEQKQEKNRRPEKGKWHQTSDSPGPAPCNGCTKKVILMRTKAQLMQEHATRVCTCWLLTLAQGC